MAICEGINLIEHVQGHFICGPTSSNFYSLGVMGKFNKNNFAAFSVWVNHQ